MSHLPEQWNSTQQQELRWCQNLAFPWASPEPRLWLWQMSQPEMVGVRLDGRLGDHRPLTSRLFFLISPCHHQVTACASALYKNRLNHLAALFRDALHAHQRALLGVSHRLCLVNDVSSGFAIFVEVFHAIAHVFSADLALRHGSASFCRDCMCRRRCQASADERDGRQANRRIPFWEPR